VQLVANEIGGDAPSGERRQNPDMRHGCVADRGSTRKSQRARYGVSGADELVPDERTDRAARFEQLSNLSRREVRQLREPDHGSAEHVCGSDKVVLAVEHADIGSHPDIMAR
jgi:hypothetical protein